MASALKACDGGGDVSLLQGLDAPFIAASVNSASNRGLARLIIAPTSRRAEAVAGALTSLIPDARVMLFPAWETLPHERLSPSPQTVGQRLAVLRAVSEHNGTTPLLVVTSVRAATAPMAKSLAFVQPITLRTASRGHSLEQLAAELIERAYSRVDLVARRGEFAVRGGILDVFAPEADHPYRIEFFGDEVDQIRPFSVADQRSSTELYDEVELSQARELLLSEQVRERAGELRDQFPPLAQMLEKMSEGIPVEGMEALIPALGEEMISLLEHFPKNSDFFLLDPVRSRARAESLRDTNREFLLAAWQNAALGSEAPVDLDAGDFLTLSQLRQRALARGGSWILLDPFDSGFTSADFDDVDSSDLSIHIDAKAVPSFQGKAEGASEYVRQLLADDWRVLVVSNSAGLAERARDVLLEASCAASLLGQSEILKPGTAAVSVGRIESGFELPDISLAVFSESDFFGRSVAADARGVKRLATRRKNVVDPLQLQAGDLVVHLTHGIGRFVELAKRQIAGARKGSGTTREYVVLEYAPSKRGGPPDKLFVPTDQLDLLSRYVGGDSPSLSKMGGSDWSAAKSKARKAVRDIAVELVKLYSARMSAKGFAFSADTPWQRELEDSFAFAETADQLQTIDEIKADMERAVPMDRLLSGDVGFGKTEVAVRAAFKAIQDGKQVAMLVPTTLLVKQHLETFTDRFAGFPVKVRALSRFQTDAQAREVLKGLADGSIDMVIGTHRILTEKVLFKDLGLLIIDEEQRFGVEHKDALKKLKTNVDILAMSATPIPRTLEMAVTGIREMSTLQTPPEERHPVFSYVGPRNPKQVAAAIRRELLREGQVFYVHNRVQTIQRAAAELAELVPEATIAVAHGQMGEHRLEQVVDDFWERKIDVLVSTTIIETGLDISNANTIIIDRADRYGLSQLHQLRGRVGRGRERAYAYFLYDDKKPLSETAANRLETIAVNNELGAGMQVALKDLEIRGAGNLLGAEQAGHIAGVGFDLYLRMIGEAVANFKGEDTDAAEELRIELPLQARFPEEYISSERLRLEAYQKVSAASIPSASDDAIDLVVDELLDRYGALPAESEELIALARLRRQAAKADLKEVTMIGPKLRLGPVQLPESMKVRLARLYPEAKLLAAQNVLLIPAPVRHGVSLEGLDLIAWVKQVLDQLLPPRQIPDAAKA